MDESVREASDLRDRLKVEGEEFLAEQFLKHRERLWRIVRFRLDRRLSGRVDPDDVLQECWIATSQRLDHFLENESLSLFVWFRLIAGQTLVDIHRRHLGAKMRDAYREVGMHGPAWSQATSVSIAAQFLGNFTSPSQAAIREETARRLEEAVESMDAIDREVVAMRHFEELTNIEVAEVLGIQQKAASIRYVRAIRRLKDILQELPGFGTGADDG